MTVSNVSLGASEQDIKEFFSFSGEIEYVEMQRSVAQNSLFSLWLIHYLSVAYKFWWNLHRDILKYS